MNSTGAAIAPTATTKKPLPGGAACVVVFVCENCGRVGSAPSLGIRLPPRLPDFAWPIPVRQVAVPCAGRLQPEHFLKILEDGAEAVGVVACEPGNCHHLEGNRRCRRRLDYVSGIVRQAGLDGPRLAMFQLPGSAAQDMALGIGAKPVDDPLMEPKIRQVREAVLAWLEDLPPNPLGRGGLPDEDVYEVDSNDGSDE